MLLGKTGTLSAVSGATGAGVGSGERIEVGCALERRNERERVRESEKCNESGLSAPMLNLASMVCYDFVFV